MHSAAEVGAAVDICPSTWIAIEKGGLTLRLEQLEALLPRLRMRRGNAVASGRNVGRKR